MFRIPIQIKELLEYDCLMEFICKKLWKCVQKCECVKFCMSAYVQDVHAGAAAGGCLQKNVKISAKVRLCELQKKVPQQHLHAHWTHFTCVWTFKILHIGTKVNKFLHTIANKLPWLDPHASKTFCMCVERVRKIAPSLILTHTKFLLSNPYCQNLIVKTLLSNPNCQILIVKSLLSNSCQICFKFVLNPFWIGYRFYGGHSSWILPSFFKKNVEMSAKVWICKLTHVDL